MNRQIRIELRAAFAKIKGPLILHITPQGAFYSSFSETAIFAGRSQDITRTSKFVITIWPPHPDRPVDIFEIWRSAREIQRQLIQAAPLQGLWLQFYNKELASWCPNGRILDTLWPNDSSEAERRDTGWNDITNLAQNFLLGSHRTGRIQFSAGTQDAWCIAGNFRILVLFKVDDEWRACGP